MSDWAAAERRLPVYLLLDCSESMVGEGIDALQQGVHALMGELRQDPHALETAWVSIISFSNKAEQVLPLTEVTKLSIPKLRVHPGTALGGALELLQECIGREVRPHTSDTKGDWRPIAFLLSDGEPTDSWESAARGVRTFHSGKPINLIAIGCGEEVEPQVLRQVSDNVLMMRSYGTWDFQRLFQWISASLSTVSQRIASSDAESGSLSLAEMPDDLFERLLDEKLLSRLPTPAQRLLFLAARCSRTSRHYLIRYRLDSAGRNYAPVKTHPVEADYFEGQDASSTNMRVAVDRLAGILPCPYCEAQGLGQCFSCKSLFCLVPGATTVTCPGCRASLTLTEGGDWSVSGRLG